jgi:ABC-2 type transport system permease protein
MKTMKENNPDNNCQLSIVNCQFWKFVQKEFRHIFRDVRTMMIIIGIPVIQILIIGFAVSTEVKNVKVAVYDPSNDVATRRIIDRLDAGEYFDIVRMLKSAKEIETLFQDGEIGFVVVFSDNFGTGSREASIQLITDATDPNKGTTAAMYAMNIIRDAQQELLREYAVPFQIIPEMRMLYNPGMKSSYNFVPGLMGLVFILICAMMTSIAIVREKETGTMEVLLASPVKPATIIISKMVPYFLISWFILIIILLLAVFVLHVPVTGSLVWLNVFSLIYIIVALSLGLLISTLVNTQMAALLASGMGLMMPIMILSGLMFPIESIPPVLQGLSSIIPARWYISGVRKLMIEGVGVSHILKEMLILMGMAAIILTVSLKNFKTRL